MMCSSIHRVEKYRCMLLFVPATSPCLLNWLIISKQSAQQRRPRQLWTVKTRLVPAVVKFFAPCSPYCFSSLSNKTFIPWHESLLSALIFIPPSYLNQSYASFFSYITYIYHPLLIYIFHHVSHQYPQFISIIAIFCFYHSSVSLNFALIYNLTISLPFLG